MVLVVLIAVIIVRALRDSEPSPEVRRLLPQVVLFLEHKDPLSIYRAKWHPPSKWTLYCSVRYLGNTPLREQFNLYIWEVCQEYRADGNRLAMRSGWSVPSVIWIVNAAYGYKPEAEFQTFTDDDIPRLFPERLRRRIFSIEGGELVGTMEAEAKRRACIQLLLRPRCRAHY